MAFSTGWNRKCKLTINNGQVYGSSTTHTDFPVLFTEDNLPSEMLDKDGTYPAQMGGGDIRFTEDAAGTTKLPCYILKFITNDTPASGKAVIYVAVDITSDSDTEIYVWYNTSDWKEQPKYNANTDSDGFQGSDYTWANYEIVLPMGGYYGLTNLKKANDKNLGRGTGAVLDSKEYTIAENASGDTYCSFPSLVKVGERLYCAVREATVHTVSTSGDVHVYYSDDIGATWTEDTGLEVADASYDLRDPGLFLDDDDTLWIVYAKANSGDTTRTIHYRTASSPYSSWSSESAAISTATKAQNGAQPIQLAGGRICVPAYETDGAGDTYPLVIWTDNDGSTWTEDYLTSDGTAPGTYGAYNEFSIAEDPTSAGTVVAVIREDSDGNLQRSVSTNSCATWSSFTDEIPLAGTSPDRPQIRYSNDGDLICAFSYDRTDYTMRMIRSTDDGLTWETLYSAIGAGNEPSGYSGNGGYCSPVEYVTGLFVTAFYYDNSASKAAVFCVHCVKKEDDDFMVWGATSKDIDVAIDRGYEGITSISPPYNADTDFFNNCHDGSAFTISGWAKFDDVTDKANAFCGSSVTSADRGVFFAYENRTAASSPDSLRLFIANGSGTNVDNQSSAISGDTTLRRYGVFCSANSTPTFIKDTTTYSGSTATPTYSGNAEKAFRVGGASYTTSDWSAGRLDGDMEMWSFSGQNLGADYEKTRYNAENAPASFVTEGTSVDVVLNLTPTGIASLEAFGTSTVSQGLTITPVGITSLEAHGASVVAPGVVNLDPTGIASLEAFGAAVVSNGTTFITPTGIASAEAFGAATVTPGTVTISPTGIASLEAFGTATVSQGTIISPTGIASLEAFGVATVVPGAVTITPVGITSLEAFGTAVVTSSVTLLPTGISSLEAFGTAVVSPGAVIISPTGIASLEEFGTATIANLLQNLSPTGIASLEEFGIAVVTIPGVGIGVIENPSILSSTPLWHILTVAGRGYLIKKTVN